MQENKDEVIFEAQQCFQLVSQNCRSPFFLLLTVNRWVVRLSGLKCNFTVHTPWWIPSCFPLTGDLFSIFLFLGGFSLVEPLFCSMLLLLLLLLTTLYKIRRLLRGLSPTWKRSPFKEHNKLSQPDKIYFLWHSTVNLLTNVILNPTCDFSF